MDKYKVNLVFNDVSISLNEIMIKTLKTNIQNKINNRVIKR